MNISKTITIPLITMTWAFLLMGCGKKEKKITAQQQAPRQPVLKVDVFIVSPRTISESIEVPGKKKKK